MRRWTITTTVAVLCAASVFVLGCKPTTSTTPAAQPPPAGEQAADAAQGAKAEAVLAQKTCPVMGGAINKAIFVDHNGRRVYFCCAACVDAFKKDPQKYLAKVDAELAGSREAAATETHSGSHAQ